MSGWTFLWTPSAQSGGLLRRVNCRSSLAFLLVAGSAGVAQAHPSGLRAGDPWWTAWSFDPLVLLNVAALGLGYIWGLVRVWRHAGTGRGVARWRAAAFAAGLAALLLALVSPLDTLSDDLSWVHMTQHMVLMTVAAPLMVLGSPGYVLLWALPPAWRPAVGRWPRSSRLGRWIWSASWNPLLIWVGHAAAIWLWHLPAFYQRALDDPLVHDLEHLSFFLAACLFWRVAIDPRSHLRLNPGLSVLYLFTTSLHATVLGAFMALAPRPWYPVYADRTGRWNLSPLEDQQLAGLIMWMPACLVYALAAAALFAVWLSELERSSLAAGGRAERETARRVRPAELADGLASRGGSSG